MFLCFRVVRASPRAPSWRVNSQAGRRARKNLQRRQADDLRRGRCNADSGLVQLSQQLARDRVFDVPCAVVGGDESKRHFEPVVREPPVDLRLEVLDREIEAPAHSLQGFRCDLPRIGGMPARGIEHHRLDLVPIVTVRDGDGDLFPEEREVARVVVDGLVEDAAVRDRHDAARELATPDPHGRVGGLHSGWLPHFHDRGLEEPQGDHVAPHSAHHDSVPDREVVSSQDEQVTGERRHHLLHCKRQARAGKAQCSRHAPWVVEPDGGEHHETRDRDHQADHLAAPEANAGSLVLLRKHDAQQAAQKPGEQHEPGNQPHRDEKLRRVRLVQTDEADSKEFHGVSRCRLIARSAANGATTDPIL